MTLSANPSAWVCKVSEEVEDVEDERRRRLLGRLTSRPAGKRDLVMSFQSIESVERILHKVLQH